MADNKLKGHVEFRQPAAKLVADMPEDAEMREHLEDMQEHDGYPGSCAVIDTSPAEEREPDR